MEVFCAVEARATTATRLLRVARAGATARFCFCVLWTREVRGGATGGGLGEQIEVGQMRGELMMDEELWSWEYLPQLHMYLRGAGCLDRRVVGACCVAVADACAR